MNKSEIYSHSSYSRMDSNKFSGRSQIDSYDVESKLNSLLRYHLIVKYTKSDKKTYEELLDCTIELEIENNQLLKTIETTKSNSFKLEQQVIDLQIEIDERNIEFNSLTNRLKLKNIADEPRNIYKTHKINNPRNVERPYQNRRTETHNSDLNSEISISDSSIEVDEDLVYSMKKQNNKKYESVIEENQNFMKEINKLCNEVKVLKSNTEEKDKIISILYQELDNLRSSDIENNKNNPSVYSDSFSTDNTHLDNLNNIKSLLCDFLKNFGIKEEFNHSSDNLPPIQLRMKEIEYIIVNMRKINIIFKSLFIDYSKNILNNISMPISLIEKKLGFLQTRLNKLTN